jgi:integrase
METEFAKDVWDMRRIPGTRYPACRSQYFLNFTKVASIFRPIVKRYIKWMLTHYSHGSCRNRIFHIRTFLDFFLQTYPSASTFQQLSRKDIEAYLVYLKTQPSERHDHRSPIAVHFAASALKYFLEYLERISAAEAPQQSVGKLIWSSDIEKRPSYYQGETVKYIPEGVLQQLDQHAHHLSPVAFHLVIILRASGWRISDVLNLRYDTCLEHTTSGWWLCGDILKTQVLSHKVPITDEIAAFVRAQCTTVQERYGDAENPAHYLFPSPTKRRQGYPVHADTVKYALNRLARKYEIKDDTGTLFTFKSHAFRHTKAVELINNGMSLLHVQKWMAHLSPEMTLVYAKLLAPTLRKEWEQAFSKGAVRIDVQGQPKAVNAEQLGNEQEIEWEHIRHNLDAVRLPNGYCFKPKKANCPTQDTPCYTCRHFCTTPDFLSQLEHEEREMRELIELGEKAGSEIWIERNSQKLNRLLPVIQVIHSGDLHHPAGKVMREYTPEERAKRA